MRHSGTRLRHCGTGRRFPNDSETRMFELRLPAVLARARRDRTILPLPDGTIYRFPREFLWGAATASHQVEGGDAHSDWWRFERQRGRTQNFFNFPQFAQDRKSDHWRQFDEDVGRMRQDLGLRSYRFSIEWSRIEPEEGRFDHVAIDRYAHMAELLRKQGIRPLVTLFHWSSPDWIWDHNYEQGSGWHNPRIVDRFARYCERIVPALAPHVDLFVTLNEPNIFLYGAFSEGILCPGHHVPDEALVPVVRHLCGAHVAAWRAIKAARPEAEVGIANHFAAIEPLRRWNLAESIAAGLAEQGFTWCFPEAIRDGRFTFTTRAGKKFVEEVPGLEGTADFMGMNYYERFGCRLQFHATRRPSVAVVHEHHVDEKAIWPREINTLRFADFLARVWQRYHLPIYVTENGRAHPDDAQRLEFLHQHLATLGRAITEQGVDVRGYYWWSLLDNQEWANGFVPRLGLYAVDYTNGVRSLRDTGRWYAELIRRGAITVGESGVTELQRRIAAELDRAA
jgi:beta-glucosidase